VLCFESTQFWSSANTIQLYIDKTLFMQPLDITEGLSCLFAAYWLFNISYPTKLMNTYTFLEREVFGLQVTAPRNPVIKLMKTLEQR
jgi:hypothetical protein